MFLLIYSFMGIFCEFQLLSENTVLYSSLVVAGNFALICLGVAIAIIKTDKKTKLEQWFTINASKQFLSYKLLKLNFPSIESEVFLTNKDIKELLSIKWTILGISVAVFLIWNVVAIDFLENKKPQPPQSKMPTRFLIYLQKKENFYFDATLLLSDVYFLLLNVVFLCIETSFTYITPSESSIFSQSLAIFVLYLCTNTIVLLILDILKPFNEKKKSMLQETKTTDSDIDLQNKIFKETEKTLTAIESIEQLQSITTEEANKLKAEILDNYMNHFAEIPIPQKNDTGDNV